MNIQNLFDAMSVTWRQERSKTQMTLSGLIERLKELPPEMEFNGFYFPHSYRGYYEDLAFEPIEGRVVKYVLEDVEKCLDKTFCGYKGGDFLMDADTPIWIANYGCGGKKLLGISDEGELKLEESE